MQKLADWYSKLGLIVLNILVLFILLNVGIGVYYAVAGDDDDTPRRDDPTLTGPLVWYSDDLLDRAYPGWDESERTQLLTENWTRPFICGKYTHYRERPSSGQYVNVTEVGYRLNTAPDAQPNPWPPPDDAYIIFVFGGSTTFGYGVADDETIPAYLEAALNEAANGQPVYVYNFAQGGFFSTMEMIQFQGLLNDGYRPDMAVFIDGHNDAWFNSWFGGEGPYNWQQAPRCDDAAPSSAATTRASGGFELPIVRLANDIRTRIDEAQAEANGTATPDEVDLYQARAVAVAALRENSPDAYQERLQAEAERVLLEYTNNQRMIRAVAAAYQVQAVFVWQPSVYYRYDNHIFPVGETLRDTIQATYGLMAQMDWQAWPDFLYLADMLAGRDEVLFVDEAHYNAGLNAEIGGEIAAFILDEEYLP